MMMALAAGCAAEPGETVSTTSQAGTCGLGSELIWSETLTAASIPSLSALDREQIVLALQESSHTDVTTVEEAFNRADQHEINRWTFWNEQYNQFYVEIEYGAGDNSYGAIFYWGTSIKGGVRHDGDPYECGPTVINYDRGDTARECAGFLTYANTASLAALDAYLPSHVAQAIVSARAAQPFTSVASLVAVPGVADARLADIFDHARAAGQVDAACYGIQDRLALSVTEASKITALVNEASRDEVAGILSFLINPAVIDSLVSLRPFAAASNVAQVTGVGPAVLRALRNAATKYRPWEQLVESINAGATPNDSVTLDLHFDWTQILATAQGFNSMNCFGIDPALLPAGATVRQLLGNGNELLETLGEASAISNHAVPSPAGLTDIDRRSVGVLFKGCYISYPNTPQHYDWQAFFVDMQGGSGVHVKYHFVQ